MRLRSAVVGVLALVASVAVLPPAMAAIVTFDFSSDITEVPSPQFDPLLGQTAQWHLEFDNTAPNESALPGRGIYTPTGTLSVTTGAFSASGQIGLISVLSNCACYPFDVFEVQANLPGQVTGTAVNGALPIGLFIDLFAPLGTTFGDSLPTAIDPTPFTLLRQGSILFAEGPATSGAGISEIALAIPSIPAGFGPNPDPGGPGPAESSVPEPGTLALIGLGLAGLPATRRFRQSHSRGRSVPRTPPLRRDACAVRQGTRLRDLAGSRGDRIRLAGRASGNPPCCDTVRHVLPNCGRHAYAAIRRPAPPRLPREGRSPASSPKIRRPKEET